MILMQPGFIFMIIHYLLPINRSSKTKAQTHLLPNKILIFQVSNTLHHLFIDSDNAHTMLAME